VPETLWNYSLLTMQQAPQLPMMGVRFAPEFLYSFIIGCGFVTYFAWDRFNNRQPQADSFSFSVMKELDVSHLGGKGALRRAYLLYLVTLLAIYVSMTFFGKLVIQTLNGLNLAGLQVDAASLKFDSPQWPLLLAFGLAGLAPLVPPLRTAEDWLFGRAYRAVGIPVRINQTTRNLIDILDEHLVHTDDPLGQELKTICDDINEKLKGTATKNLLDRAGKVQEAVGIVAELTLLVGWARGGRGTWPGPDVSEKVRDFERELAAKADKLLEMISDRLAAERDGTSMSGAPTPAQQREQTARRDRLMATLEEVRKYRDELLAILAIYAERDPTFVGAKQVEETTKEGTATPAAGTTLRPGLRQFLSEAEKPNLAGAGPEAGLLLCMIPVALLYAAFAWQGQHPLINPRADPTAWQAVAATAGVETLRVMAIIWLPLLAAFAFRQYCYDRRDWIVQETDDLSLWTEQRIVTLGLAVALAAIGLVGVALLNAFLISTSVPRFQSVLFQIKTPLILYVPSYAILTLPVVHFAIKAADRRAMGLRATYLGVWCALWVAGLMAGHLAFWYGEYRTCTDYGTFLLDMFSPECVRFYGGLDFIVYPVLAYMAVAVFGNPASVTSTQRRMKVLAHRAPQVTALAGLLLAVPGPHADAVELKVGFRADAQPFSYLVDSDSELAKPFGHAQQYTGFIADLCYYIFDRTNQGAYEITEVPVTISDRFDKVKTGDVHVLCDPVTLRYSDPEREGIGVFSPIVFASGISYLQRRDTARYSTVYIAYVENTTTLTVLDHACMVDLFRAIPQEQRKNLALMCKMARIARDLDKVRTSRSSDDDKLQSVLKSLAEAAASEILAATEMQKQAGGWKASTFQPLIDAWTTIERDAKAATDAGRAKCLNDPPKCIDAWTTIERDVKTAIGADRAKVCLNGPKECAAKFEDDLGSSCKALEAPDKTAASDDTASSGKPKSDPFAKQTVYRFCPMPDHETAIQWFCERRFGDNATKGLVYLGDRDIILGKLRTWNSRPGTARCVVDSENAAEDLTYEPYALLVSDKAPDLAALMRLVQRRVYEFFSFHRQAEATFYTHFPKGVRMSPLLGYLFLLNGVEEERLFANPTEDAKHEHAAPEAPGSQPDPTSEIGMIASASAPAAPPPGSTADVPSTTAPGVDAAVTSKAPMPRAR